MSRPRVVFGIVGAWETLRFLMLFVLLVALFHDQLSSDPRLILWLILGNSAHLPLIAGLLLLALGPRRYAPILPVIQIAKAVSVFACALTLIGEPRGGPVHTLRLTFLHTPLPHQTMLLVLLALDVMSMIVICSPAVRPARPRPAPPPPDYRPVFHEPESSEPERPEPDDSTA